MNININSIFCREKIKEMRLFFKSRKIKLPKIYQLGDYFTFGTTNKIIEIERYGGGYSQRFRGIIECVKRDWIKLSEEDKKIFLGKYDDGTRFLNAIGAND